MPFRLTTPRSAPNGQAFYSKLANADKKNRMKASIVLILGFAILGFASTAAEFQAIRKDIAAKGTRGVVPVLLPGIADPSQIRVGEEDALHLKPQEAEGNIEVTEKAEPPPKKIKAQAKKERSAKPAEELAEVAKEPTPDPLSRPTPLAPVPREKIEKFGNSPLAEIPLEPEIAIILSAQRFFPARVRIKEGQATRLLFTSLNSRPAALVIEQLQVQRWIANDQPTNGPNRVPAEILREIGNNRMTEVLLQPQRGTYTFHDALSGAVGEIVVE